MNSLQRHRFLLQKPWWSVSIILFSAGSFIILVLISISTNFLGAKVRILSPEFPKITFTVKYDLQQSCSLREQMFDFDFCLLFEPFWLIFYFSILVFKSQQAIFFLFLLTSQSLVCIYFPCSTTWKTLGFTVNPKKFSQEEATDRRALHME